MEDYSEVCTNMYTVQCDTFDTPDARPEEKRRGTMHGAVKEFTKDEIQRFIMDREDGLV